MSYETLKEAIEQAGTPPCAGCNKTDLCANGFACPAFVFWTNAGSLPRPGTPSYSFEPTAEIYDKLFTDERLT